MNEILVLPQRLANLQAAMDRGDPPWYPVALGFHATGRSHRAASTIGTAADCADMPRTKLRLLELVLPLLWLRALYFICCSLGYQLTSIELHMECTWNGTAEKGRGQT
jgi:hypothetical protein